MRTKTIGLGIICIVALSLLAPGEQVKPGEKPQVQREVIPGGLADKIILSPGIDKKWPALISLANQVQEDIELIQKDFAAGKMGLDPILKLLDQRRAVIAVEEYALKYGNETGPFWASRQGDSEKLEIKVAMVYVSNAMGAHLVKMVPKPPAGLKKFDAVAFVVLEFHFISKTKAGEPLHNATFSGEFGYRHQDNCQWGN